jgi:hypothetical protein
MVDKQSGVVYQDIDAAHLGGYVAPKSGYGLRARQIGREGGVTTSHEFGEHFVGFAAAVAVVQRNPHAACRQL